MQQFFFFKIKRGQNKFDPEYYFVYRFSFARSLGHVSSSAKQKPHDNEIPTKSRHSLIP